MLFRSTQLFVNLADNSRLDREGFAPVGRVVEGMGVVDQLYAGYGEEAGGGMRGGKQGKIFAGGNAYLDREFPKLDRLLRASVLKGEMALIGRRRTIRGRLRRVAVLLE